MSKIEAQRALTAQQQADARDAAAFRQGQMQKAAEQISREKQMEFEKGLAAANNQYANEDVGYGVTRQDLANLMGYDVKDVNARSFSDQELHTLGQQKQIAQAKQNQMMQHFAKPTASTADFGLAGQLGGQGMNLAQLQEYVNYGIPGMTDYQREIQDQNERARMKAYEAEMY